QLTTLPAGIGKLTRLNYVHLSHNQLKNLPNEIGQWSEVISLNLSNNQLTALPLGIEKMTKLTRLTLTKNQLKTLPHEIGQLTELTHLHLENNQLTALPLEIWRLTKLRKLDLTNNQLSERPTEAENLPYYTSVDWSGNPIKETTAASDSPPKAIMSPREQEEMQGSMAAPKVPNESMATPKVAGSMAPPPPPPAPTTREIFTAVEQMPRFPGCENEADLFAKNDCSNNKVKDFISKNMKYPAIARENGVQGTVVITFVVEKDGSLSDIKLVRDIGAGCGQEALRLVNLMQEQGLRWTPGQHQGNTVRVQYNLPVKFKL
ncbi:MAG TPA: TonB family protein, partial [Saprospiraceae bacterium]|nr:TonB family protein [Saprospiraceae bacterium]HRK84071.1 TonB family protein [Saprospiraceae bacterium]